MRAFLFGLISLLLLASACSVGHLLPQPTRSEAKQARKVAAFIAEHPELMKPDTIRVKVPFAVPEVHFKTRLLVVHDTVYLQQESSQLDTLLNRLQYSLDSAQAVATKAAVHQLLDNRPVLRDTLCFDTLGISGKVWLTGRTYQLQITRAALTGTTPAAVPVSRLAPCPPMPAAPAPLPWYNPEAWGLPWWVWLLLGIVLGAGLLRLGVEILYRSLPAK